MRGRLIDAVTLALCSGDRVGPRRRDQFTPGESIVVMTQVRVLVLPLTGWVTLNKSPDLSEPWLFSSWKYAC